MTFSEASGVRGQAKWTLTRVSKHMGAEVFAWELGEYYGAQIFIRFSLRYLKSTAN